MSKLFRGVRYGCGGIMIDVKKLTSKDIGKWVIYKTGFSAERGKIKSWNDKYIFVVYKCNNEWDRFQDFTASATNPKDLKFQ